MDPPTHLRRLERRCPGADKVSYPLVDQAVLCFPLYDVFSRWSCPVASSGDVGLSGTYVNASGPRSFLGESGRLSRVVPAALQHCTKLRNKKGIKTACGEDGGTVGRCFGGSEQSHDPRPLTFVKVLVTPLGGERQARRAEEGR